jgi:glucoamylase
VKWHQAKKLRIEVMEAAMIHWSLDNWETSNDTETHDTKLGIHVADIDVKKSGSEEIQFTFFWKKANRWENENFVAKIKKDQDLILVFYYNFFWHVF